MFRLVPPIRLLDHKLDFEHKEQARGRLPISHIPGEIRLCGLHSRSDSTGDGRLMLQ